MKKFLAFETERLKIYHLQKSDIPQICEWWNDGKVVAPMGFPKGMGITKEKLERRFEKQLRKPLANEESHFYIIKSRENEPIGELQYAQYDKEKNSLRLAIKIGRTDMQGKGLGKEALIGFMDYLIKELKIKKFLIDSLLLNERATKLYLKLGFVITERKENIWQDETGVNHTLLLMEKDV